MDLFSWGAKAPIDVCNRRHLSAGADNDIVKGMNADSRNKLAGTPALQMLAANIPGRK